MARQAYSMATQPVGLGACCTGNFLAEARGVGCQGLQAGPVETCQQLSVQVGGSSAVAIIARGGIEGDAGVTTGPHQHPALGEGQQALEGISAHGNGQDWSAPGWEGRDADDPFQAGGRMLFELQEPVKSLFLDECQPPPPPSGADAMVGDPAHGVAPAMIR